MLSISDSHSREIALRQPVSARNVNLGESVSRES